MANTGSVTVSQPVCRKSMESVDKSMESMDKIHGQSLAGVLDRKQWTISSESMENVHGFFPVFHGIHGFFPWNPWIFFHGIHEFCPGR